MSRRVLSVAPWVAIPLVLVAQPANAQFGRKGGGGGHAKRAADARVDSSAVPQPQHMTGCTVFDVRITAATLVTVARSAAPPCGPIEPVLVGTPALDSARRIIMMSIALVNHGLDRLHAPAGLEAGRAALIVTAGTPPPVVDSAPPVAAHPSAPMPAPGPAPQPPTPPRADSTQPGTVILVGGASPLSARASVTGVVPGAAPGSHVQAVRFVGADAAPADTTSDGEFVPVRWSFDKLLTRPGRDPVIADDGATVLPPGDTSGARRIRIFVPVGVTGFRVSLMGRGVYVFTVPLRAAETVPSDELEDSRAPQNILTDAPGFPGHVVRDKLWLAFRGDASPEQRQAAIDAVGGVVVGGMLRGTERYYYVRFAANPDSGAAPLEHALRTLAPMPQVQDVMPDRGQ